MGDPRQAGGPANEFFTQFDRGAYPAAMAQASKEGKGAVSLDVRLIDIASIRQAEALVATADRIEQGG